MYVRQKSVKYDDPGILSLKVIEEYFIYNIFKPQALTFWFHQILWVLQSKVGIWLMNTYVVSLKDAI